ncbi:hypothetical protein C2G38_2201101 [Gigaspora rosea]|uniref:Uncharacterized protein n=1 Tax=Gigaspora rosea TaxID=44941 RepID=A0A397UPX4_9GLOM|nr:hypothetical protein C2G38_2201101 [Gigaspora rosea]
MSKLNLEELISLEQGESKNNKELNLAVKLATLLALFKLLASIYDKDYISSALIKESIFKYLKTFQPTDPLRKELENLINNLSGNTANRYNQSEIEKAYLNRALLALEEAQNIQENDQVTPIIFQNKGLTQATQNYLLQHYQQLVLETTTARRNSRTGNLERIGTPIIVEAIGIILQTTFGQYTINPTNNPRLGAILLTKVKKHSKRILSIILEHDKQRPGRIPPHISTRTQTLFPELLGRALLKEEEKQRNIYNNFLENTWVAIKSPTITSQTSTYTNNHFTDKLFLPTQNLLTLDLLASSVLLTS